MTNTQAISHIQLFQQITQYTIDDTEASDHYVSNLGLQLDRTTFHRDLYISRPDLEREIKDALLTSHDPICVYGASGSGKTSLVSKVLLDMERELKGMVFRFDFKHIPDRHIDWVGNDGHKLQELISQFLDTLLMAKLQQYILNRRIDWDTLLLTLLQQKGERFALVFPERDYYDQLYALYKVSWSVDGPIRGQCYNSWLEHFYLENSELFYSLTDRLRRELTPKTLLTALTQHLQLDSPYKAIILFDNVDTISNRDLRFALLPFICRYTNELSEYARLLVCLRNPPDGYLRDITFNSPPPSFWLINIDRSWHPAENPPGSVNESGMAVHSSVSEIEQFHKQASFDQHVLDRRIRFAEKCLTSGRLLPLDSHHVEVLHQRCRIVRELRPIQECLVYLANFDMRFALATLAGFIRYLDDENDAHLQKLEHLLSILPHLLNRPPQQLNSEWVSKMEIHLYGYIVGTDSTDKPSLFHSQLYDIVRSVQEWGQNKSTAIECLAPQVVLTVLCEDTHYGRIPTSIKKTIKTCEGWGLPHDTSVRLLRTFCQGANATQFARLTKAFDDERLIWEAEDSIELTPRGYFMQEIISLKVLYLIALMNRTGIRVFDRPFSFIGKTPLTAAIIRDLLIFLCDFGQLELSLLQDIRASYFRVSTLEKSETGAFRTAYSNSRNHSLMTGALLINSQQFLRTLQGVDLEHKVITDDMIQQYGHVQEKFTHLVTSITQGKQLPAQKTYLRHCVDLRAFGRKPR